MRGRRLVRDWRYYLWRGLSHGLGNVGLLIRRCLGLVRTILRLLLRRRLSDRGWRLVVLLLLLCRGPLLLPVRSVAIISVQLGLISWADGSCCLRRL